MSMPSMLPVARVVRVTSAIIAVVARTVRLVVVVAFVRLHSQHRLFVQRANGNRNLGLRRQKTPPVKRLGMILIAQAGNRVFLLFNHILWFLRGYIRSCAHHTQTIVERN